MLRAIRIATNVTFFTIDAFIIIPAGALFLSGLLLQYCDKKIKTWSSNVMKDCIERISGLDRDRAFPRADMRNRHKILYLK